MALQIPIPAHHQQAAERFPRMVTAVPLSVVETLPVVHDSELFKGGIHLTLFAFAAICLAYNAMRYTQTREAHSAVNVAVYGSLSAFEVWQIRKHLI